MPLTESSSTLSSLNGRSESALGLLRECMKFPWKDCCNKSEDEHDVSMISVIMMEACSGGEAEWIAML